MGHPLRIEAGYCVGAVGQITDMHARYYAAHAGFGPYFESQVATGLAEFVQRMASDPVLGLWLLCEGDAVVGSVALDVERPAPRAQAVGHLRWFILGEVARGRGWGRQLLQQALSHADHQGLPSCYLWTFQGLDAARHLYEAHGFALESAQVGTQWGNAVTEQRFVRTRPAQTCQL